MSTTTESDEEIDLTEMVRPFLVTDPPPVERVLAWLRGHKGSLQDRTLANQAADIIEDLR